MKKPSPPVSLLAPEAAAGAASATAEAQRVLTSLRALTVTPENRELVASILTDVKKRHSALEAELKKITKPMRDAEKAARDLFRPALTALAEAEALLKKGLADEVRATFEANRTAMLAAQAALSTGDGRGAALAAQSIASTAAPAGVSYREVLRFDITDPDAVPRELCSPDETKIRAFIAAYGDARTIPGVSIVRATQVAARST